MPQAAPTPPPSRAESLDGVLGFERLEFGDGFVRGRFAVVDAVKQPYGIVHGGAYAAFAEGLASEATHRVVFHEAKIAMGISNQSSFLRPVAGGVVHASGTARHRGRTTWVWDVDFTDDDGKLCATSRVTVAVRDAPGRAVIEPVEWRGPEG